MELLKLIREPDLVFIQKSGGWEKGRKTANREFLYGSTSVKLTDMIKNEKEITVSSDEEISRIFIRWEMEIKPDRLVMGDALERSYGDIEWRSLFSCT